MTLCLIQAIYVGQQLVNNTETNKEEMCLPCPLSYAHEMCVYVGHKMERKFMFQFFMHDAMSVSIFFMFVLGTTE